MKHLRSIFFIHSLLLGLVQIVAQDIGGSLGDIKYSILDPERFSEVNGKGWVIMSGQDIQGSDLSLLSGKTVLPDARGMFFRSMNLSRTDGDVEATRRVGSFQDNSIQSHRHKIDPCGHANGSNALLAQNWIGAPESNCNERSRNATSNFEIIKDDTETRPKNIALYTYIKINH